jgi:hypothetical protein
MSSVSTGRSVLRIAPALALLCTLLAACAGAGTRYACTSDAGACTPEPSDGGLIPTGTFISTAAVVWHDGAHNSDVDVASFNGALYVVFRSSTSFTPSSAAQLRVMTSADHGATWTGSAHLALSGMDLREPKLSVFGGALRVTATAWNPVGQSFHHTTVVTASSANGSEFSALSDTGIAEGSEAWRPKAMGDRLWVTAWKADELYPNDSPGGLSLFASLDGASFSGGIVLPAGPGAHQGEAILRVDGALWVTIPERAESGAQDKQTVCHSAFVPPFSFSCWSVAQSPIASPALFEFNGILFVSGEHDLPDGHARTGIWQVDELAQSFNLLADLPESEGETGAPGVVGLDASHLLLTYHSTSKLDPRVQALSAEPTKLQSEAQAYAVDALAVVLDMGQIPAGL